MKAVFLFLHAILLGSVMVSTSFAQSPVCSSGASDYDGDGWGWENNASCRVVINVDSCIDPDGDGYGWNGVATCLVTTTQQSNSPAVSEGSSCIDTDGDGYGWDGVATCLITTTEESNSPAVNEGSNCIDTDGDGYGWDGVATCLVDDNTNNPTQINETITTPYLNRYETYTLATYPAVISDQATNGWLFDRSYPQPRVVLCEDPDITMQDPSNPGYFYDAAKGQTCAKTDTVPIFTPDQVQFTLIGSEVLYENGNRWNCIEESRPSMDTAFEATGNTRAVTYESGTTAPFRWVRAGRERRHLSYRDDILTWYASGISRETCSRIAEKNFPFTVYGETKAQLYRQMWNAFIGNSTPRAMLSPGSSLNSDLDLLPADQIVGRPMQCARLSVTTYEQRNNDEQFIFTRQERIVTVETAGNGEYDVPAFQSSDSESLWRQLPDGTLGPMNISIPALAFYSYTEDLFMLIATSGGPGISRAVYACEANL